MFIVYVFNQEFSSWDYQCTLHDDYQVIYSLLQLYEEVDHYQDQFKFIEQLINSKRYIGRYLRIYYVDNPDYDWDLLNG